MNTISLSVETLIAILATYFIFGFIIKDFRISSIGGYFLTKSIYFAIIIFLLGFVFVDPYLQQGLATFAGVYAGFWLSYLGDNIKISLKKDVVREAILSDEDHKIISSIFNPIPAEAIENPFKFRRSG